MKLFKRDLGQHFIKRRVKVFLTHEYITFVCYFVELADEKLMTLSQSQGFELVVSFLYTLHRVKYVK